MRNAAIMLIVAIGIFASCTKKIPNPKITDLEARIVKLEADLAAFEPKIKAIPPADQGLIVDVLNDKELTKARLDRLKIQLEALRAKEPH